MSALVAIVDYGSGNLKSASKAVERAARESAQELSVAVTSDPDLVARADRIILPGVGAFADCRAGLFAIDGMHAALDKRVRDDGAPFLGICVGMQLMATMGREKGEHAGLGWIKGAVELMRPSHPALKVPHIGWNTIGLERDHPLFAGIETGPDGWHAYFVHSYHFVVEDPSDLIAVTDYGGPVTAAIGRDNMLGTQFHPEKSQKLGLALLANFLKWKP